MPLATKSSRLVLKTGVLSTSCRCCATSACAATLGQVSGVTVDITSGNFLRHFRYENGLRFYNSLYAIGQHLNGTHTLSKISNNLWRKQFATGYTCFGDGCSGCDEITLQFLFSGPLGASGAITGCNISINSFVAWAWKREDQAGPRYYSPGDTLTTGIFFGTTNQAAFGQLGSPLGTFEFLSTTGRCWVNQFLCQSGDFVLQHPAGLNTLPTVFDVRNPSDVNNDSALQGTGRALPGAAANITNEFTDGTPRWTLDSFSISLLP
jgi:hypothetical protein